MIAPHVHTTFPDQGGTFTGQTITLEGSLIGVLFQGVPPQVWDVEDGHEVALTWTEDVTGSWSSEHPAVGGDIQTRVELTLSTVTPGKRYRLRYPVDLDHVAEVELTAKSGTIG